MKRYGLIAAKWCTRVKRNKRNYSFGAYAEYKHIRLMCRLKNLPKAQKSIFSRYTPEEIIKWASDQSNNPFIQNNDSQTKQEQENILRDILKHFINQKYDHTL